MNVLKIQNEIKDNILADDNYSNSNLRNTIFKIVSNNSMCS
jgi:hypothetical protein